MKFTRVQVEQRYSDDSGVQFGVTIDSNHVTFESESRIIYFPIEELDWLIEALVAARAALLGGVDE